MIYNRPKKEKTVTDCWYAMIYVGKGKQKKFASTKKLPPDTNSLLQKIKISNLVSYTYYNCLDNHFTPLNPENYGWKKEDHMLKPISFLGSPLPTIEQYEEATIVPVEFNSSSSEDDEWDSDISGSDILSEPYEALD